MKALTAKELKQLVDSQMTLSEMISEVVEKLGDDFSVIQFYKLDGKKKRNQGPWGCYIDYQYLNRKKGIGPTPEAALEAAMKEMG